MSFKQSRKLLASLAIVLCAALVTGCHAPLPAFSRVRDVAHDAAQLVINELPATATVGAPKSDMLGCDGEGMVYTGIWLAILDPSFDGEDFVEALPDALPSAIRIVKNMPVYSFPTFNFYYRGVFVGVTVDAFDDGKKFVDILAVSECGILEPSPSPGGRARHDDRAPTARRRRTRDEGGEISLAIGRDRINARRLHRRLRSPALILTLPHHVEDETILAIEGFRRCAQPPAGGAGGPPRPEPLTK